MPDEEARTHGSLKIDATASVPTSAGGCFAAGARLPAVWYIRYSTRRRIAALAGSAAPSQIDGSQLPPP